MKKTSISIIFGLLILGIVILSISLTASAIDSKNISSRDDKNEENKQKIIEFLLPQINEAVASYYKEYFSSVPGVTPNYGGKVLYIKYISSEIEKNTPQSFEIAVQVTPFFGPHISVGKDNLTFRVFTADCNVQLIKFEHVKSFEIPPHYRYLIIDKWPPER